MSEWAIVWRVCLVGKQLWDQRVDTRAGSDQVHCTTLASLGFFTCRVDGDQSSSAALCDVCEPLGAMFGRKEVAP